MLALSLEEIAAVSGATGSSSNDSSTPTCTSDGTTTTCTCGDGQKMEVTQSRTEITVKCV